VNNVTSTQSLASELALGLVLQIGLTYALSAWGRWVGKRRGGGAWKWAPRAPWISFALLTVGVVVCIVMLMGVFARLSSGPAAERQAALSQGISRAMTVAAIFFVPGYLTLFVFLVAAIVGSLVPARGRRGDSS
jgi:hypothetical protein